MGREFLEQPLPTKVGIVVVALGFLFNISMTVLKGRKTSISTVLLMGLWGLAIFFLFSFVNPENLVRDKMYWWFVVHLWVEGVWELILASLLAYVLVKTTGVDREVIDKWMYLIIAFALMSGLLGTGHHYFFIGVRWLLAVDRFGVLRLGAHPLLPAGAVRLQHGRAAPPRPAQPGRHFVGQGHGGGGLLGCRCVGLYAHPGPGELLHPRHPADGRPRSLGFLRRVCPGGDHHHQLRHAHLRGRLANSPAAQSMEKKSFWVMTIGMCVMVLALTIAGVMQSYLQRWLPEGQALSYMATQDELRGYYWLRVVGGVIFLIGQFMYFASFFIGGKHVESHADAMALKAA